MRINLTVCVFAILGVLFLPTVRADFHVFKSEINKGYPIAKSAYYAATTLEYKCTRNQEQGFVSGYPDYDYEMDISIRAFVWKLPYSSNAIFAT